jgi:hypothetical protein
MSYAATVFNVMIASPSDVNSERGIVREVLGEWNVINSQKSKAVLLPLGWETHSTPEMGASAQSIINRQILKNCDLLVAIFWTRVGTATGDFASGSVEEIEKHLAEGKPAMLYFSSAPVVMDSVDQEQYKLLKDFRESCKSRGLLETYADLQDFRTKFTRHIQLKLNENSYFSDQMAHGSVSLEELVVRKVVTLSAEARDLLRSAAATTGHIMFLKHLGGEHLQAGGRSFIEDRNPRSAAVWKGAIDELRNERLIEDQGYKGEMFRVTREGYEFYDAHLKVAS